MTVAGPEKGFLAYRLCTPSKVARECIHDVDQLLNAICARGEECLLSHGWQPILSDPDDEPLVQLAIESDALRIVSHNVRHLRPAVRLGVELLRPREFLDKLRL